MNQTQLLLSCARKYVNDIDELLITKPSYDVLETKEWIMGIEEIFLKSKLLFAEFDNGIYFINECKKVDSNPTLLMKMAAKLESYKKYLQLFIEHLNEFRVEKLDPKMMQL